MGLLDIFKKEKENRNASYRSDDKYMRYTTLENRAPYEIKRIPTKDGKLQIDFIDNVSQDNFRYYDTTRLIVDGTPIYYAGQELYQCQVSWYGKDDAIVLMDGKDISRRTLYSDVLIGLDLNAIQNNPEYTKAVMTSLLEKSRVDDYLKEGFQTNPRMPRGNYLGNIYKKEDGTFGKYFDKSIGMEVHYSPKMQTKRAEYQLRKEKQKQESIAEKQAQIKRLQSEIDRMSR